MYLPSHFAESRVEVMQALMQAHPLGTLVTVGPKGLNANHVPFEYDPHPAPYGTLRAHVARANPLWREFSADIEPLVIFQGPQVYISPSWYQTKQDTGKVVPTFNYIVVHAYGAMRAIDDVAWVRDFVGKLTQRFESTRTQPWAITDAPEDFIAMQLRAIVGIEIPLTRLIGKWKASQNRPAGDRDGVVQGLRASDDPMAQAMAAEIDRRRSDGPA